MVTYIFDLILSFLSHLKKYKLFLGLSLQFGIQNVPVNELNSESWLTSSIALLNNINNYTNAVYGLMGNNNNDPNDDIIGRDGRRPADAKRERDIYDTQQTCNTQHLYLIINQRK
jgi:hypothetical protein